MKLFDATSGTKLTTLDAGLGIAMIVRQGGNAIAASLLGNLWLYDAGGTLHHTLVFNGQIFSFALATDGQVLFVGGAWLRHFRVSDGTEILPPIHDGRNGGAADTLQVSPDGRYLAAAVGDGVRIWRLTDATAVVTLPGEATFLAFAPDGRRLAVSHERAVHIYAVPEGERVVTLAGDLGRERVAYSSDGRWVAVSGPRKDIVAQRTSRCSTLRRASRSVA